MRTWQLGGMRSSQRGIDDQRCSGGSIPNNLILTVLWYKLMPSDKQCRELLKQGQASNCDFQPSKQTNSILLSFLKIPHLFIIQCNVFIIFLKEGKYIQYLDLETDLTHFQINFDRDADIYISSQTLLQSTVRVFSKQRLSTIQCTRSSQF